jgi:N-acetylated-alpha-linked acidic dipeptidase
MFTLAAGYLLAPDAAAQGPAVNPGDASPIEGYTAKDSVKELRNEDFVINTMSANQTDSHEKYLSEFPGEAATPGILRRQNYIASKLRDAGMDVQLRTFYVYLADSQKVRVQLDMTAPFYKSLATKEKQYPWYKDFDKTSVGFNEGTPAANLTRQIVYANYGRDADFTYLASQGISVRDKIVIVRYGGSQRSEPPYQAYIHGAAGLIYYSDPQQFAKGPAYPNGLWAAPDTIQRGTIYRWTLYNGDPLTPGYAGVKNAPLISVAKSDVSQIAPTTPIGYGAAEPLLKNMAGPVAPKSWQGGLPFTYHLGPGPTTVHLKIDIQYKQRPITDIVATIPGTEAPDKQVVLDTHYDTWNYDAGDNISGTAVALELARVLGQLHKNGWKPKRSIVILFTSGEERGISGSAEWTEWLGKEKMAGVVAEINSDVNVGHNFAADGVPALNQLLFDVTKRVPWPRSSGTAYDDWTHGSGRTPFVRVPGGGADFMSFVDRFGVPIMSASAHGPSGDRYHCICDDYYAVSKFQDPGMVGGTGAGRVEGLLLLRLADADILPLNYDTSAAAIVGYLEAFKGAEQLKFGYAPVSVDRDIAAAERWAAAAKALQSERHARLGANASDGNYATINSAIMQLGRALLVPDGSGLPGRPWYENQIYAPQFHDGFSLQLLPGLYDSLILFEDPEQAKQYEGYLFQSLQNAVKITESGSTK